jgi:hypothetical protein
VEQRGDIETQGERVGGWASRTSRNAARLGERDGTLNLQSRTYGKNDGPAPATSWREAREPVRGMRLARS